MQNVLCLISFVSIFLGLTACGNGGGNEKQSNSSTSQQAASSVNSSVSSSVNNQAQNKNYSLHLDFKWLDGLAPELTEANLAVATVDLSGKVLQLKRIQPVTIKKQKFSQFFFDDTTLTLPSALRMDTLLIVDAIYPLELSIGENIRDRKLFYTPLTSQKLIVSGITTYAYNTYLSAMGNEGIFSAAQIDPFNQYKIDQLEHLIKNANEFSRNININISNTYNVDVLLESIKSFLAPTVNQSIDHIKNGTQGSIVDLVQKEGGMHLYIANVDAFFHDDMIFEKHTVNARSEAFLFDKYINQFNPKTPDRDDIGFALGIDGWVDSQGTTFIYSFNSDKSITVSPTGAPGFDLIYAPTQAVDISGKNMVSTLSNFYETSGLARVVDKTKSFPPGSKVYLATISTPKSNYILMTPYPVRVSEWGKGSTSNITQISDVFSADVQPNEIGFKTISFLSPITPATVQLIDDSAKTAKFYFETSSYILEAKGTWEYITLPYPKETQTKSAIKFTITSLVTSDDGNSNYSSILGNSFFFTERDNSIYSGAIIEPESISVVNEAFNGSAHNAIQNALVGEK